MTTTPAPPASNTDATAADQTLHTRSLHSAHVIAGVLDAGLLNHVGRPDRLPTALFPDVDPDAVQAIWNMALGVGIWAGKAMLRPQWEPEALDKHRDALTAVGYASMAASVNTASSCGRRTPHPADDDLRAPGHHE